ncbi:GIY-YIG nuclease family protein [Alcanivorax jadensis]|uniref:GIY-YIG nuclease family protein n=1 Tax=Alcanivorax jadensis TaxID=64988 RepID=UPI00240A2F4F|nr:GIY-YIG nuclease family protein [Alcanivorax jadensis]MDF1638904.1 GIY-YIG nuclease family protein [Alcanivorax jadensis]
MARNIKGFTEDDDALLAELGVEVEAKKARKLTPREERIIAGFEEIQRFVEQQGYHPRHGEDKDIFERLYAVRLDRLRALEECQELLSSLDHQGLLSEAFAGPAEPAETMSDDELLAELDVTATSDDISELRHVRSSAEKRAAEEIANRERCEDFATFKPLFELVESELKSGQRTTRRFGKNATIELHQWFILDGQTAYVADVGEDFDSPQGKKDARLRVIFSNGTESNLLRLSLVRALYKDETSRRITEPDAGPLFGSTLEEDDLESGTIYVLRSHSKHPFVSEHRELIHKIGVTGGKVESRIANAARDATYLLADVEVVASYKLAGVNRIKLEKMLHQIFAAAQIELTINDRFGHPVKPKEWFLVPLHVIDEAVALIINGSITDLRYDPEQAALV